MAIDRRENAGDFYPGGRAVAIRRAPSPTVSPVASPSQPGADAGDYYLGGKTISTRPVATGGDMKHSEFKDVVVVPERFNDTTLRDKLNEVIGKLKGNVSAAIAITLVGLALAATADVITVQTAQKGSVYNDELIVTNIVFNASEIVTTNDVESIRNDVASNRLDIATLSDAKADAEKRITVDTGAGPTNLVVRPVYANANLVIRECETANGQKQYRLIRKED